MVHSFECIVNPYGGAVDSVGQRLAAERLRLGLSQEALGAIGGVARNAQANYEAGRRQPDAVYLERVAGSGVDVLFVITGKRLEVDVQLLGICEAALADAYCAARPGRPRPAAIRTRLVAQTYNDVMRNRTPGAELFNAVADAAERIITSLEDPVDPELLERNVLPTALLRAAEAAGARTVVITGGRSAGRDYHEVTPRPGRKK